jgi:hypothetical protein
LLDRSIGKLKLELESSQQPYKSISCQFQSSALVQLEVILNCKATPNETKKPKQLVKLLMVCYNLTGPNFFAASLNLPNKKYTTNVPGEPAGYMKQSRSFISYPSSREAVMRSESQNLRYYTFTGCLGYRWQWSQYRCRHQHLCIGSHECLVTSKAGIYTHR